MNVNNPRIGEITVGDLRMAGTPPGKLAAAFTFLAEYLHDEFDRSKRYVPDSSKEGCILSSLTVRDFLFRIGFRNAEMRSCVFIIRAVKDGETLHSLGIGNPEGPNPAITTRWDGHAVVVADDWLIDTTLYQAKRPQWPSLPGMMAVPMAPPGEAGRMFGLPILSGAIAREHENGAELTIAWLDQPTNRGWKTSPHYLRKNYRTQIADRLINRWKEATNV